MLSRRYLPPVLLLLAVCLTYLNFFGNSFHFDDFHTVTDNPAVRSLGNLPRIFTDTTAFSVLPANQTYRPIVTASLALDYALARGYNPFWFHLSTLLWFVVLLWVLFLFAERVFDSVQLSPANRWLGWGVAAWFGLHPAMAETVNYVIQRGDLYCTLGCLAALVIYVRRPLWRRFGLYLVPFVLGMLSKPPAAVFPLLLLFYVFFFEAADESPGRRWRISAVAAVPAAAATVLLLWLQSAMTPRSYAPTILSASAYRLVQPFVWLRYLSALLLPLHLNVDTDLQPISTFNAEAAEGLLFVLGLLAVMFLAARRCRLYPIAYGVLWFVLTQLPTSLYTLSEVENDHRMFFSFPGLMIAVVWALRLGYERLASQKDRREMNIWLSRITAAVCGLALCGYAYGAHRRNAVWHDEPSLWADDAAKSPHNGRGLMIFGLTRMNAGDYAGALELFNRALLYTPNYATLEVNLGIVNGLLADAGQHALGTVSEAHFQRAVALSPNDDLTHAYYGRWLLAHGRLPEATSQLEAAVALNTQRELGRDLLLNAYAQAGNTEAAKTLARTTLAIIPGDALASAALSGTPMGRAATPAATLINASLAAYRAGQYQQSISEAQAALKADPHSAEAWNNIGAGYGAMHEWDLGIAAEQQALKLNPNLTIAANNLRWFQSQRSTGGKGGAFSGSGTETAAEFVNQSLVLNQSRQYDASLEAARKALALDPHSAEAWNNIAADDEAMGRWNEAIDAARKAIALRPDFQLAKNNLQWSLGQKAKAARN